MSGFGTAKWGPRPVEYVAAGKLVLGRATFKAVAHWGHAAVCEHHLNHDVTQCDTSVQPTHIHVGTEGWSCGSGRSGVR